MYKIRIKLLEKRTRRVSLLKEDTYCEYDINGVVITETIHHWVAPLNIIFQFLAFFCPVQITINWHGREETRWIFPFSRVRSRLEKLGVEVVNRGGTD